MRWSYFQYGGKSCVGGALCKHRWGLVPVQIAEMTATELGRDSDAPQGGQLLALALSPHNPHLQ